VRHAIELQKNGCGHTSYIKTNLILVARGKVERGSPTILVEVSDEIIIVVGEVGVLVLIPIRENVEKRRKKNEN
tara:strand:- start:75 stop:296 length:222 start_codon:yes stop_codon:yes gene_type:complete